MKNNEQIPIEITLIVNDSGPVNKTITLGPDGKLIKQGVANIYSGQAYRAAFEDWRDLGPQLEAMRANWAICLGRMAPHLPSSGYLTTKGNYSELAKPGRFARTQENIVYAAGFPALVAIDV
jgi:hypothetical protein